MGSTSPGSRPEREPVAVPKDIQHYSHPPQPCPGGPPLSSTTDENSSHLYFHGIFDAFSLFNPNALLEQGTKALGQGTRENPMRQPFMNPSAACWSFSTPVPNLPVRTAPSPS